MFVVAPRRHLCARRVSSVTAVAARRIINSDGVKDMTHEAKAKVKDLTWPAALKPQTLYTVQC